MPCLYFRKSLILWLSLLKAAEGCIALTDQYCTVDSYQALDLTDYLYVVYFGIFYMILLVYCRLSDPVFNSVLVRTQPHPVTPP
jgi:hypothetical protein